MSDKTEPISVQVEKAQEVSAMVARDAAALPMQGMGDMAMLGENIAKSGIMGVRTPAAGLVLAATCHQERMSFLEFQRRYHVTDQGKITMRSDRMLAEFMIRGGTVEWLQYDDKAAVGRWSYGANQDKEIGYAFEEAEKAGYVRDKSNWVKDPGSQLRARAITRAVRMLCPGAVCGLYTPEEMEDVYGPAEPRVHDPQEINADDAAARAAAMQEQQTGTKPQAQETNASAPQNETTQQATVEKPGSPFPEGPDPRLCPVPGGSACGMPWANMGLAQLYQARGIKHLAMTEAHFAEIEKEIKGKEGAQ